MTGLELQAGLFPASQLVRDTEVKLRRVHNELAGEVDKRATAERAAGARRRAALELAAALSVHFRLGVPSAHVDSTRATEVAARFEGASLVPEVAGQVVANMFGEAVGELGRKARGAVYTPNDVVEWMVAEAFEARVAEELAVSRSRARVLIAGRTAVSGAEADALGRMMLNLRVLDPAAGVGAFLVGSARVIARTAQRLTRAGVRGVAMLRTPLSALEQCCYGFEIDPESAEVASTAALLSTMSQRETASLRRSLVSVRNPLVTGLEHPAAPSGWDLIVMNPPYVGEKHIRARLGEHVARSLRDAHGFARDLLVHFALCGLDGLRRGGAMSAIVSDTTFTIDTAAELRRRLVDDHTVHSIAWCRPFAGVAVRGGILTVIKSEREVGEGTIEWIAADNGCRLAEAPRNAARMKVLRVLPSRPLFRPTNAASAFVERWANVDRLDEVWHAVAARRLRGQVDTYAAQLAPGDWTLLGIAVRSGQGLATGDDRRYVGYVEGTADAEAATARTATIIETIRATPEYANTAAELATYLATGMSSQEALLELATRSEPLPIPGRKPFRVVEAKDVRTATLSDQERLSGIAEGPTWIPYETSDRSGSAGGARWLRINPTVVDWSTRAVALLYERRESGHRRPVLRNQDLWFRGGVTHNRVTSYLRARRLPRGAIFSSESPVYVPIVGWLDEDSLLALLNSSLVEFAAKTFLASRNHIEVGHLRRFPVPVLDSEQKGMLASFGQAGCEAATMDDRKSLSDIEASLDEYVRKLYGVGDRVALEVIR